MRRTFGLLGLAAALLLGGGTSLLVSAFTNSAGAATTNLEGYTINALAEPFTAQYEQPNFPLPATPSLEFDVGYATSTDGVGAATATASTLYPGQVIANAGPELSLLVPGVPLPPAPTWPLQAVTDFPQAPNTASLDEPGANMDSVSNASGASATATLGDDASTAGAAGAQPDQTSPGGGNPLAATSSLLGLGTASGTSSSTTTLTNAIASASSTVAGISLLGGFINLGTVTSTATANSDGTTGTLTGSTTIANATIAGESVAITASGIQAAGKTTALALPLSTLNSVLGDLGITIKVTSAVDTTQGSMASRTLDGLQITINLTNLDKDAYKFAALLPASLTSQLPVAIPDEQIITMDLATVTVSSAATPAGDYSDTGGSSSDDTSTTGGFTPSSTGDTGSIDTGSGTFGGTTGGFTPTSGSGAVSPGTTSPAATTGGTNPSAGVPLATTPTVFKGVGSSLILLGILAAAALAYLYKRADDASELLGTACADGDPLGARFSDDDIDEPGGFA